MAGRKIGRQLLKVRFAIGKRRLYGVEPGNDALDISVNHGRRMIEGDRNDRGRRIRPDPGKLKQLFLRFRKTGLMALDNELSALM